MRIFGRRRFLGASAGAVCVGCASNETPELRPATTGSLPADASSASGAEPVDRRGAIEVGPLDEVLADTAEAPRYVPEARAWLVALPADQAATVAKAADPALRPGLERGLLALYEKCPHLGCRVPYCSSSGWFECPCHGALFTTTGEHRTGPGPRGLDPLPVLIDADVVSIGVAVRIEGPPVGTTIVEQVPLGPHCVEPGPADH